MTPQSVMSRRFFFTIIVFFFLLDMEKKLETVHFVSLVWKICSVETFIPLQCLQSTLFYFYFHFFFCFSFYCLWDSAIYQQLFFFFSAVWILASPLVPLWMWTKPFGPVTSLHREMRKVIWTRSVGCVCTLVQSRRFLAQNVTDGRINNLSCTILYWVLRNCPLISFYVLCWKLPLPLSSHKRARWDPLAFFSPDHLLLLRLCECFRQRIHRTYLLAYLRNILS